MMILHLYFGHVEASGELSPYISTLFMEILM